MKKIIKYSLSFLIVLISILSIKYSVKADNPFVTRTVNRFDELVETQDAYESIEKIKKIIKPDSSIYNLNSPSDIYIDEDDYIYIVDTNSKSILILDNNLNYVIDFGADLLISPRGIYVRDNIIYVADYGLASDPETGKVVLYDFSKELKECSLKEIRRTPSSPVLAATDFTYRPEKIAVDANLTMYVVCEGSYSGILTINDENRFISYFAPNNISIDFKTRLRYFFYGENEKANLMDLLPTPPYNVFIDDSGYIYTVTQTIVKNDLGDTLKRVNIGGQNFYPSSMIASGDFVGCVSSHYGNCFAATKNGFIYEYDIDGNILFIFGGNTTSIDQLGLFKSISAIAIDSKDNLFILDKNDNSFQIFRPTNFTNTVHLALGLFNEGKYNESKGLWEQVLVYNSMTDVAHKGIGLAHFMNAEYQDALREFKLANDKENYSEAYWEIRNIWISNNILYIFIVFISIILIITTLIILNKKKHIFSTLGQKMKKAKEKKFFKDGLLMFGMLAHPLDTTYFMKTDKKIRYYNGLIFLVLLFFIYLLGLTSTGFIFNNVVIERTILFKEVLKIVIPIALFVIANYLSSSLLEGEGTFKAILLTTVASLMPIIIIYPILILVSNFLTYSESFIYYFGLVIMMGWSIVLLLVTNKELHNYTFKRMILNILMTILLMLVLLIVVIICYLMISQVVSFVKDIISEVIFHG